MVVSWSESVPASDLIALVATGMNEAASHTAHGLHKTGVCHIFRRMCPVQDVVTRYASQTGHHVERRFGWDCHGLPVEHEIDKKLGAFLSSTVSRDFFQSRVVHCMTQGCPSCL